MIDFTDDEAVNKLARLIWRLEEWAVKYKTYPSSAPSYESGFLATRRILGLEDYVSDGHRRVRTSRLIHCAGCGRTHMLPVQTEILMVSNCVLCSLDADDPDAISCQLYPVRMLLASLPVQVEEAVYGRLADSYFSQLDT